MRTSWIVLLAFVACDSGAIDDAADPIDADFAEAGKADGALAEGSPQAIGVLRVANEGTKEQLAKTSGAGLGTRTTDAIMKVRNGKDKKPKTADDVLFSTLAQLDAVPYVGPASLSKLLIYAEKQGWVVAPPTSSAPLAAQSTRCLLYTSDAADE